MEKNNFYIITGGPGVGKTTLINALKRAGFLTIEEEARKIIKAQIALDGQGVPWKNKELYARLMLDASAETFEEVSNSGVSDPVFFDRGILDTICYMNMETISLPEEVSDITQRCIYNKNVFLLPPWKEIYERDAERKQSWKEAVDTFDRMKETYSDYGYSIILLPKASVVERRNCVIDFLRRDVS